MTYVEKVLQPGETVRYKSTIHWVIYLPAVFLFAVGALGVFLVAKAHADPAATWLLMMGFGVMAVGFGLGLLSFLSAWFRRWTTEIAVTDRRIILKRGFVRRHTVEMNMDKVESVDVNQSVVGRILGYGDILVRGTGAGLEPLHNIEAPIELRNRIIVR